MIDCKKALILKIEEWSDLIKNMCVFFLRHDNEMLIFSDLKTSSR